jgi:hypothetical protein
MPGERELYVGVDDIALEWEDTDEH